MEENKATIEDFKVVKISEIDKTKLNTITINAVITSGSPIEEVITANYLSPFYTVKSMKTQTVH